MTDIKPIFLNRIDDIKVTGLAAMICDNCAQTCDTVVRITLADIEVVGVDRYVCEACALKITKGRKFDAINQEIIE